MLDEVGGLAQVQIQPVQLLLARPVYGTEVRGVLHRVAHRQSPSNGVEMTARYPAARATTRNGA
jgi:hypothetical protein